MEADNTVKTVDHKPHAAFFRQSGWLMIANIVGGALTWAVHFLNKKIPESEYAIFGTLLMVTACLPVLPLQMVLGQQTARALAVNRERQLAGIIRQAWLWTFLTWAIASLVVLLFQGRIVERWQLSNPAALWVTLAAVLVSIWMPLFSGVLQGRQDFFWLGWSLILGAAGRVGFAALIVLALSGGATGMMIGTAIGIGITAIIAIWRARDLWTLPRESFDARGLLRQVVPLMLGFGVCQFMFTSDTMFAKAFFSGDEMAPYVAAGTLSRALLWLVLPLATVMFPKLVHSAAKSEKTNLMNVVLLGTAILAICGGIGLCVVGPWVVKLVYSPQYVAATTALLPWYAGAMVPLALANVLINDLMARSRFRVVAVIVPLIIVYGFTLPFMIHKYPGRLEVVLQTLGGFNLLLLVACAGFAWSENRRAVSNN